MTDLKAGMLVTTSDGQSYIVVKDTCGPDVLYSPFGSKKLENVSDIIRIEAPPHIILFESSDLHQYAIWADGAEKGGPLFCLKNFALAVNELEKCYGLVRGARPIPNSDEHLESFQLFREGFQEFTEYLKGVIQNEKG